jgi:hypothetical protein
MNLCPTTSVREQRQAAGNGSLLLIIEKTVCSEVSILLMDSGRGCAARRDDFDVRFVDVMTTSRAGSQTAM